MFLAKSYCDIGNSQSSSSIVAPDGEITTTLEYDDHIGASIKDLGKVVWFLQDGNKIVQRANRPTLGLYLGYRRHFHVAKTTRSPTGCQS